MQNGVTNSMKILGILFLALIYQSARAQNQLLVNGDIAGNDCVKIITDINLDTAGSQKVTILSAEINSNCLNLGILYKGCKANVELVTDNHVIESETLKLNFILRYIEAGNCKADVKTKLSFDLSPFRSMRTGKSIFVTLSGTPYSIRYANVN